MNDLERFRLSIHYGSVDRTPFYEFMRPAWPETAADWAAECQYAEGKSDF
jgi:hypothetical protein